MERPERSGADPSGVEDAGRVTPGRSVGLPADHDLSAESVAAALPGRSVRCYPAVVSTQADALAWARRGAPSGAVVVADYQASARGRIGRTWNVRLGQDLGFSLVVHPDLPPQREGWTYAVAACGLADVLGEQARIAWPDRVLVRGRTAAEITVDSEDAPEVITWAVVTAYLPDVAPPRAPLLARVVAAIEERADSDPDEVLAAYRDRCQTLGRQVRARMLPLGPSGPQVTGRADDVKEDGALVLDSDGRRIAVRPQKLGALEEAL